MMTEAERKEIAVILKEFRARRHLSHSDLAGRCHVMVPTVFMWERGEALPAMKALRAMESIIARETDPRARGAA